MAKPLPSEVWRLGDSVTPEEKLVLLALIDYGNRVHPSQGTLALKTGFCVRTIRTIVASLRRKGLITTTQRGAKSLDYSVRFDGVNAANGAGVMRQTVPINAAGDAAQCGKPCLGILTSQGTSQPNQGAADAAAGGRDGFDELVQRIRARDPRADVDAQRRVCSRVMEQHGLAREDIPPAWRLLCLNWARTGNAPYDTLQRIVNSLEGARDVRAVVLHKIRGVAA
jgi:hypothetical protein